MRVAIVGGGLIGLLCAYELRRRGITALVVEKGRPGEACSSGNTGWIVPSFSGPLPTPELKFKVLRWALFRNSPLHIKPSFLPKLAGWLWQFWRHCNAEDYKSGQQAVAQLSRATMPLFDRLKEDGVDFEMHRAGVLFLFLGEAESEHALQDLTLMQEYGYTVPRLLRGSELKQLEPSLSDAVRVGFFVENERHLRPETLNVSLVQRLRELEVEVRTGVEVTGGIWDGDSLTGLTTATGCVEADCFVLAAGAWSGRLASKLGFSIPLQAAKGYSVTVQEPAASLLCPLYLAEAKVAISPFSGANRIAGTLELSGVNERLDTRRMRALTVAARKYVPGIEEGVSLQQWVGMRSVMPDGLPAIGQLDNRRRLFMAAGHAMLGVTLAPVTSVAVADLVTASHSREDLRPFNPKRFSPLSQ